MYYFELADIMFMVNSLKNPSNRFNILNHVKIHTSTTRSSDKITLRHVRCTTQQQQHFYFNRIPRLWNKLPKIDITLSSNSIKVQIYEFLWSHFMDNFDTKDSCTLHFSCPCTRCIWHFLLYSWASIIRTPGVPSWAEPDRPWREVGLQAYLEFVLRIM